MPRQKHTNESIIATLQNLAANLGKDTLTKSEVQPHIPVSTVTAHFGSLGNALEAAGLRRTAPGENLRGCTKRYTDAELFQSLLELENRVGHEPGYNEYQSQGRYSVGPFRKRFGRWADVLAQYRIWRANQPHVPSADPASPSLPRERVLPPVAPPATQAGRGHVSRGGRQYGEFIRFRGLTNAPTNELGVVFLFGMVCRELGFVIEALGQGFPDCEGKHLCDTKKQRWERVQIEFEYKASNFRVHEHSPEQCDVIVCWENDWPDCPVEVVELRSEIQKLSPE